MKKEIRARLFDAYIQMGQKGLPVDPELYQNVRQMLARQELCGRHARSSESEATLPEPPPKPPSQRPPPRPENRRYAIEEIIAEEAASTTTWRRFLVRWAGYEPEWEAWRIPGRGRPGDPVETWEPLSVVKHTEALEHWMTRTTGGAAH